MGFDYRLMRGRQGASGHARNMGDRALLSARGLPPGEQCTLYALRGRQGRALESRTADRDGCAQFIVGAEEKLFLAANGRVVLWEDGPEAEAEYLLASACLADGNTPGDAALSHSREEPASPSAPAPEEAKDAPETNAAPETRRGPRPLRPAGDGEAVDALPILRWPAGTEDLRLNCTLRPPFSPFYAPGWRFVQVPSPLPEAPFCAVGYRARDARVTDIAYAIPGPARPPIRLAGYHYRPGKDGAGYWVITKRV